MLNGLGFARGWPRHEHPSKLLWTAYLYIIVPKISDSEDLKV